MKKNVSVSSKRISTGSGGFFWAVTILGVILACCPLPGFSATNCYISAPGCLDTQFGAGTGEVTTNPASPGASQGDYQTGAVVDSLGRIVVVGNMTLDLGGTQWLVMERFNSDGSVDNTFGSNHNGIVFSSTTQWINAVALQQVGSEEEIVVAGNNANLVASFLIARYHTDGTLDTSFGTNGQTTVSFGSKVPSTVSALAVQSDGQIVLVGSTGGSAGVVFDIGTNLAMARLTVGGVLDTSFGSGGKLTSTLPAGVAAVIQPTYGKIVVGGGGKLSSKGNSSQGFVVARFTTAGVPDATFGSGGAVVTSFAGTSGVAALALDSSGRLVAVGTLFVTVNRKSTVLMALARYLPTGQLDPSFGSGTGKTSLSFPGVVNVSASRVALQPYDPTDPANLTNQKILVAGGADSESAVVRCNTDGTLDASFGPMGGLVETASMGSGGGLALDSTTGGTFSGTFVTVGNWTPVNLNYLTLARYFQ
jgi:uncharacterized delta-60 repeat protein